jgi:hypothetical protein
MTPGRGPSYSNGPDSECRDNPCAGLTIWELMEGDRVE